MTTGPRPHATSPDSKPDRATRRAARLDDPRFERLRTPLARRRLTLAMVALLVVEAGCFVLIDRAPTVAAVGVGLVLIIFVFCLGSLKASTRGVEELPPDRLDERQLQMRGLVYARAYQIGTVLLTLELIAVGAWVQFGLAAPGVGVVLAALLLPFHVAIVLPTLVAAWARDL